MARVPMVTRTITTTNAKVLCVSIAENKTFEQEVALPRTYKDEKTLMKQVKAVLENENVKPVHVISTEEVETLYGMSEQEFIQLAKILPPRTANSEKETNDIQ